MIVEIEGISGQGLNQRWRKARNEQKEGRRLLWQKWNDGPWTGSRSQKSAEDSEDPTYLTRGIAEVNGRNYRLNPARYQWATWPSERGGRRNQVAASAEGTK